MGEPVFQAQQESKLIPPSLRSDSKAERWIKRISQAPAIWKLTVPVSWSPLGYMNTLHIYVITKMTRCLQKSEWSNNPERSAVPLADVTNLCIYSSNPPSFPKQDKFCDLNFTGDKLERDRAGWHRSARRTQTSQTPPHTLSAQRKITYSPQNSQGRKQHEHPLISQENHSCQRREITTRFEGEWEG